MVSSLGDCTAVEPHRRDPQRWWEFGAWSLCVRVECGQRFVEFPRCV